MPRRFIILDLDGTIVAERPRYAHCDPNTGENIPKDRILLPQVIESVKSWREKGHFIAVCSNNVRAEVIIEAVGLLPFVDFVLGKPSMTLKVEEYAACFQRYRSLYRSRQIRWKIQHNRVYFVDNDTENLQALQIKYKGIRCYERISDLSTFWTDETCNHQLNQVSIS